MARANAAGSGLLAKGECREVRPRDLHLIKNTMRMVQQLRAGRREFNAAAQTVEKAQLKVFLQGLDRMADGRLGQIQFPRGHRKAAHARKCREGE